MVLCYGLRLLIDAFHRDDEHNLALGGCDPRPLGGIAGADSIEGWSPARQLGVESIRKHQRT